MTEKNSDKLRGTLKSLKYTELCIESIKQPLIIKVPKKPRRLL